MRVFLLISITVLNFAPPYLKLLAFLLEILETFLYLLLVPHVKFVTPLDVCQSQMLYAKMLTYLENKWLHLSTF
jgi:hypothetical protein